LGKRYGNLASPNALNEDKPSTLPRQKPKNSSEPSLPVSWVIDAVCNPRGYGSGNDLFACLQALLGWRAHEESFDIARFRVLLRSKAHKQNYAAHDSMFKVSNSELQSLWYHLRDRVDEWRMTLHALPTFVEYNFNTLDGDFQREYKLVQGTYERNVLELELLEAKVRDHLDMIRSAKSMEMAQLSIYESKRVLLCKSLFHFTHRDLIILRHVSTVTVLAFVFIPISLATSIYGMVSFSTSLLL
jgi:hypothetical protein